MNVTAAILRFVLNAVGGGTNHSNVHQIPCLNAVGAGKCSFLESLATTILFGKIMADCHMERLNC